MLLRTRLSLYYVFSYITLAGIGLIFFPDLTLKLFLSNGVYDTTFVQMTGVFSIGLGIFVLQIIRLRIESLYPTTIAVRLLFCLAYVIFYIRTHDPFFLVVLGIVGLGLIMTSLSYISERHEH
jgi:hypothetical protein